MSGAGTAGDAGAPAGRPPPVAPLTDLTGLQGRSLAAFELSKHALYWILGPLLGGLLLILVEIEVFHILNIRSMQQQVLAMRAEGQAGDPDMHDRELAAIDAAGLALRAATKSALRAVNPDSLGI